MYNKVLFVKAINLEHLLFIIEDQSYLNLLILPLVYPCYFEYELEDEISI